MPAALFNKGVDLDLLYPPFLEKLLQLLATCQARGNNYLVTEGHRSWGRSLQLNLKVLNGGPRAAPAGYSPHNYGLAVDTALIIAPSPKRVVRWGPKDFDMLVEEGKKLGLHCGMPDDMCHVGLGGFASARELGPLKTIYQKTQNLKDVWAYLDSLPSSP